MQDSQVKLNILVLGGEEGERILNRFNESVRRMATNVNRTSGAAAAGATSTKQLASAADGAANATNRAAKAQENYFLHIAKTTVQSALVNKAFLVMVDSMGQAIKQVDLMANFPKTIQSMGGSATDASQSMKNLMSYVGSVGGNLGDATSMVTRFTGATKDVKSATAIFVGLNNALIAGDSTLDEQRLAAIQFAQALERGKPDMREWMALTQNMSFQLNQVATAMGIANASELGASLRDGSVSMAEFVTKLTELSTGTGVIAQQAMIRMTGIQFTFNVMKNTMVQGLAAILNAFGRSNITVFFEFFTDVIKVLTGWIVTLINWLGVLANVISRLLGGGDVFKKIVGDTGNIDKNLGAGAGNAGAMGDNLDGAAKSAAKLNKSLASFDKMNILAEKESTSGGGGKADAGGGGVGAGFDASQVGALNDAFAGIGGKIKEISKWAKIFAGILVALAVNGLMKKIFGIDPIKMFISAIGNVVSYIGGIPGKIVGMLKSIGSGVASVISYAASGAKNIYDIFKLDASRAIAEISIIWQTLGPKIVEQFGLLKTGVVNVFSSIGNGIKAVLDKLGITDMFIAVRDRVVTVVTDIKDKVVAIFNNIKTSISNALSTVISTISDIFSNGKGLIMLAVTTVTTAVVNGFNTLKTGIINVVMPVVESVVNAFNSLKTRVIAAVTPVINAVVEAFNGLKAKLVVAVAKVVEIGQNIASAIKTGIATYVVPIIGPIAEIGKRIGQGIVESARSALGPFADAATNAIHGMKLVFGQIHSIVGPVVKAGLDKVNDAAHSFGKAMGDKIGQGLRVGMYALGGILTSGFMLVLRQGPQALVETVNGFIKALLNGPATLTAIMGAVQTMFASIAAQTQPIIDAVVQMITILANAIIENGPTMITAFFTAVMSMLQELTKPETITRIIEGAITLFTKIIDGLVKALPLILAAMLAAITKLIDLITEPTMLDKIITSAIDLLLKILLAIIEALPKIIDGMIKMLVALIAVITRPDILKKIIDATILLIITIALALIDNLPKIIEAGVKLIIALAKALTDPATLLKLLAAVWQIVVAIFNGFFSPEAIAKWGQIGADLIRGLWEGISNMGKWIGEKIKGFGEGVVKNLKSFFGIKSPSRVMRDQIGKMLGEGIASGIEDSAGSAISAAESAATGVMGVFSGMETSVGKLQSDFSVNGALSSTSSNSSVSSVNIEDYTPYDSNAGLIDQILTASNSNKPVNLTVQIGEDKIASKVIDLINEKTQMSGRNVIYV